MRKLGPWEVIVIGFDYKERAEDLVRRVRETMPPNMKVEIRKTEAKP